MLRTMLKAKMKGLRITATSLHYEGSIGLDKAYLDRSGILPNEAVDVLNAANGARFRTYVIEMPEGTGGVELYGPAARLGEVGDEIVVLSYALFGDDEIGTHSPTVVDIGVC